MTHGDRFLSATPLSITLAYCGPSGAGKCANLRWLHGARDVVSGERDLRAIVVEGDRALMAFFHLKVDAFSALIGGVGIQGLAPRIREDLGAAGASITLVTACGEPAFEATQRVALHKAHGVVFVVDSQEDRLDADLEAMALLRKHLRDDGRDPDQTPTVVQYNKRDVAGAIPLQVLEDLLNPTRLPHLEAIALNGTGVARTASLALRRVLDAFRS